MKKLRIKKLKISRRSEKVVMFLSLALIPALVGMTVIGVSLFYFGETEKIDLYSDYLLEVKNNQKILLNGSLDTVNKGFEKLGHTAELLDQFVRSLGNSTTTLPSYYANQTLDGKDLNLEFSAKHNFEVDFQRSSYLVYQQPRYGNWSAEVNDTIAMSSALDIILPSMYQTSPQILWMELIFDTGVVRQYPYVERNVSAYDPTSFDWYTETLAKNASDPNNLYFSEPTIDEQTGRLVINAAHKIISENSNDVILRMVITFDDINKSLNQIPKLSPLTKAYIFTSDRKVLAHPKLEVPTFGWNATYLNISVSDLELVDSNYSAILDRATIFDRIEEFVIVNGTTYMMTLSRIEHSDLILAIIRQTEDIPIKAEFPLVDILLLPVIAVFSILITVFFTQRKWGVLKGMSFEEILQSVESVASKVEDMKESVTTKVSKPETVVDGVSDVISEKIKEKSTEIQEYIEEKSDEIEVSIGETISSVETMSVDTALDIVDEKIEDKISEITVTDKIKDIINFSSDDKLSFLDKVAEAGIDVDKLRQGDLSSLDSIDNPAVKLVTLASSVDEIKLSEFARVLNLEEIEVRSFMSFLPADKGVSLDVDTIKFNKELVAKHIPELYNIARESFI